MNFSISSSRASRLMGVGLMASLLTVAACDTDTLLEVEDPDTVNPGTLEDPALLQIVINGALGEFTNGYAGGESFVSTTALMSDEFFASGSFTTRIATDRRDQFSAQSGNTTDGTYVNLHQARYALRDAADRVAEVNGTTDASFARLKALEGYTTVALAEGYCGAVPLSFVVDGVFEYGMPRTQSELVDEGVALFDEAIAAGGSFANLARIGKGRALLAKGSVAAAAAAVSSVPTSYVYHIQHSVSGSSNGVYSLQTNGRYSISDNEGINGLPFRSAMDPRVRWYEDPAGGFDQNYRLFISEKYTGFASPLPLATGVEARLIEAEAALAAGNSAEMLSILNELRANVNALMTAQQPDYAGGASLDPLTDPGTADARRDLLFQERAYWLFLTGHRLGDLRRLVRDYGLSEDQVYPTGEYHQGGSYGDDVVFEIDFAETNNPNYQESLCTVGSP